MSFIDKQIYKLVKKQADAKFIAPTSVYKSAWIVREYKKMGGRFTDPKPVGKAKNQNVTGLTRWFREKWINVNTGGPCGRPTASTKGAYPLCRPTVKVSKDTPKVAQAISKQAIADANKKKQQVKSTGRIKF